MSRKSLEMQSECVQTAEGRPAVNLVFGLIPLVLTELHSPFEGK